MHEKSKHITQTSQRDKSTQQPFLVKRLDTCMYNVNMDRWMNGQVDGQMKKTDNQTD